MAIETTTNLRRRPAPSEDGGAKPKQPAPPRPPPLTTDTSTSFYASQVGDASVINYSYTDLPLRLMAYDVYQFFRLAWAIPYVVWPLSPTDSGPMSELTWTLPNLWCFAIHGLLIVLQLTFVLGLLPMALALPVWTAAVLVGLCLALNHALCMLLNGSGIEYHSDPKCAPALPEHAHEQWIFLNGVAVGQHWMQSNLDRLALTFKRPILGIHNKTDGIIFDVIECLIQRNFAYATTDVRLAFRILRDNLYRPDISKVVFILHSQGGIEGGLVLDWLLQELPQDLLAKLEVYTFGNAANHFNNPYRTVDAQSRELGYRPCAPGSAAPGAASGTAPGSSTLPRRSPVVRVPGLVTETSSSQPAAIHHRAIGHIEHYAHTFDFVALWGVLHFVRTLRESPTMPRFLGRVFARTSPRGGHQFCQHYLDGMFPLARHPKTGEFVGCAETNEFMETDVQLGREGDESANVHEAFEQSWVAALQEEVELAGTHTTRTEVVVGVEVHSSSPVLVRQPSQSRTVKVKDVSRLWQYRNGRAPDDKPKGPSRLATITPSTNASTIVGLSEKSFSLRAFSVDSDTRSYTTPVPKQDGRKSISTAAGTLTLLWLTRDHRFK